MSKLANRAKMTVVGTPGVGRITLGGTVLGFQSFADAGVVDGDLVSYLIEDGAAWEVGRGTYRAADTSLARTTILESSNADAALYIGPLALVMITPSGADFGDAGGSATAAAASAASAAASATLATNKATDAATHATDAATAATNAATASANAATASANAATSATNAAASATTATTKASDAATSATAAAASQTAAATSATNAAASATTATTKASDATTAATAAAASETAAATSATNAAASAATATTQAGNASTSATAAAASQTAAATSATTASTQAANASASATAAASSAADAAASAASASSATKVAFSSASLEQTFVLDGSNLSWKFGAPVALAATSSSHLINAVNSGSGAGLRGYSASGHGVLGAVGSASGYGIYGQGGASAGGVIGYSADATKYAILGYQNTYALLGAGPIQTSGVIESTSGGFRWPDGTTLSGVATQAQWLANTSGKALSTDVIWGAAAPVTLTDGATITPDFGAGINFVVTLGGNRTLANPSNIKAGQSGVILVKQDGTGSRTLSWGSYFKWPSGTAPTLTTTASRTDKVYYYVESATIIHVSCEKDSR